MAKQERIALTHFMYLSMRDGSCGLWGGSDVRGSFVRSHLFKVGYSPYSVTQGGDSGGKQSQRCFSGQVAVALLAGRDGR